mgnify:FL=1
MEQFNFEKYLKNPKQKIVTRDGRSARIVCTDRKSDEDNPKQVVALVYSPKYSEELCYVYYADGRYSQDNEDGSDLFFAPTKQEGWMNIYRTIDSDCPAVGDLIYTSEQAAKESISVKCNDYYITTIKVEWEE